MKILAVVLIVAAAVVVIGLAGFFFFGRKPDMSSYLPLKEPRISALGSARVLEVKFAGNPTTIVKKAYDALFKAYFSLRGVPKGGPSFKPPRARFSFPMDMSAPAERRFAELKGKDWAGAVAIPLPADLQTPASMPGSDGLKAEAATWEYGDVAEILHLGSYDTETATIQRLEDFIIAKGYLAIGQHEEEYLVGPGRPFVSPKDYWTIIRYRVEKVK